MLRTMLTYEMIINAQKGDPYAMQQILSHYAGYINHAASFVYSGDCRRVNRDIQELIEADLMVAILKWKDKNECVTE